MAKTLHWSFICGEVAACITWSQTLLVFHYKTFIILRSPWPAEVDSIGHHWSRAGLQKPGGLAAWPDSLKIYLSGSHQPAIIIFLLFPGWVIPSQADINTIYISPEAELFPIPESEQPHLYSILTSQVNKLKTSFYMYKNGYVCKPQG